MNDNLRYVKILKKLCEYYSINQEEFMELLRKRDNRYILLLLLKNNNCLQTTKVKEILKIKTSKSINNNLKLAEEKLLINKFFREQYFELENTIIKNDITNL